MSNFNYASLTATSNTGSAFSICTATVSAIAGKNLQVVGFDGSSSDQAYQVELQVNNSTILTMHGSADNTVGRHFGEAGPIATAGQDLDVVVTGDAAGDMVGNIIYRIVM